MNQSKKEEKIDLKIVNEAKSASETELADSSEVPANSLKNYDLPEIGNKRGRSVFDLVSLMDNYTPLIPDVVTDYYLSRAGFECEDVRVKRLLGLAAQKFMADVATNAYQYAKIRQQGQKERKLTSKSKKTTLQMEDLSSSLSEYGINLNKPDYYL